MRKRGDRAAEDGGLLIANFESQARPGGRLLGDEGEGHDGHDLASDGGVDLVGDRVVLFDQLRGGVGGGVWGGWKV